MTREEAIAKFDKYRSADPFPSIQPALLNSADVFDYINTIGMIWPYEDGQLNGVTLSLRVGDIAVYWNEKNEKIRKDIRTDGEFKLMSNSIAYIQILEELRLPAYIIVRFNLRVTITYRGLLLGTGPIVDPGFDGKINIPVHNLTNNDYVFAHGEPLIEMEFTKISPNNQWHPEIPTEPQERRVGKYKNWKPNNDNIQTDKRDIDYYLRRANQGKSIQSSLPPIVYRMEETIKGTKEIADRVETNLSRYNIFLVFTFVSFIAVIVAIVGIFKSDIRDIRNQRSEERINILQAQNRQDSLLFEAKLNSLYQQRRQDSILIDSIKKKVKL